MLTPDERRKVESYLAVKYGITLKGSYLDSDGNLTWDMAENQAYTIGSQLLEPTRQEVSPNRFPQHHMRKVRCMRP